MHWGSKQSGVTLPEVLVASAITGIVSLFAFNIFSDWTKFSYHQEAKAGAVDDRELAAQLIRKTLSNFVQSVTGQNAETAPGASFWACGSSSCTMEVSYGYSDSNGVQSVATLQPMRADCVSVADSRLASNDIPAFTKDSALGAKCLSCAAGQLPQLSINLYSFDANSGAPTLVRTKQFPDPVGKLSHQGALAMGVCVDVSPYSYNLGTAATPLMVNRYDRWAVSLLPIYLKRRLESSMTAAAITSNLGVAADKILITSDKRFAPGFRFTPTK